MIEWFITDMHFAPVIFILLVVLALGFLIGISYPSNLVMAAIFGAAFIFTFITLLTTAILFKSIPESESPWTQIYTNDVNASVVIDYGENHKVTAGDIFGMNGKSQTSNFDGEIRITVSRKENSANTIFGD